MGKELTLVEQRELAAARAARRAQLREAYQRMYNNPFRTNSAIFDPVGFRYEAARAFAREYYKLTPRSLAIPLGLIGLTVILQKIYNREVAEREATIRSGNSTYYERALWSAKSLYWAMSSSIDCDCLIMIRLFHYFVLIIEKI